MSVNFEDVIELHPEELLTAWAEKNDCSYSDYEDSITIAYGNYRFDVTVEEYEELHYLDSADLLKVMEFWADANYQLEPKEVLERYVGDNDRDFWKEAALDWAENVGVPRTMLGYLDLDSMIRDLKMDYMVTDSFVFSE